MTDRLELRHLYLFSEQDPQRPLVEDLSFRLGAGKTLAMVGESGSGKSLTALSIMGLLPLNLRLEGEILFHRNGVTDRLHDWDPRDRRWQDLRGREIGFVFQEPMTALNPLQTLGQQLMEAIAAHPPFGQVRRRALEWMEKVQLPDPVRFFHRYPHQVSGGQKQRLVIAMALCHRPGLLIADEPTTALDVTIQKEVVTLMRSLASETQTSILFITHDLALAAEIADEVCLLYKGRSLATGTVGALLHRAENPYARKLLAAQPRPEMKGIPLPTGGPEIEAAAHLLKIDRKPSGLGPEARPLLEVRDLEIRYGRSRRFFGSSFPEVPAVSGVNFDLFPAQIMGLVGESGSGKSSIGKAILGLVPVSGGSIWMDGQDLTRLNTRQWRPFRARIQMVFQDPYASLNPRRSVAQTLEEPLLIHRNLSPRERRSEIRTLLDEVGLVASSMKKYPHEFSGGQRQRLAIARALASRPQILVCDESVSALDLLVQAQILNLLSRLRQEKGLAMLFISHDLSVVQYLSDQVWVLHKGRVVERQDAVQLFRQPQHPYTQRLIQSMPPWEKDDTSSFPQF